MDKKILLIILILCLVTPTSYILFNFFPPENRVLVAASWDDALAMTSMHSFLLNFENPWIIEESFKNKLIFNNPVFGTVYLFVPLGLISNLIGLGTIPGFIFFTFIAPLIAAFAIYKLLELLTENKKEKINSIYLYFLAAGFGGLIYFISTLVTDPISLFIPDTLRGYGIGFFINSGKVYYQFAISFAIFTIISLLKKRKIMTSISLGITFLLYPMFGFTIGILILIYNLLSYDKFKAIMTTLKTFIIAFPIILPWLYFYFRSYDIFKLYIELNTGTVTFLPSLILAIGILSFFIFYFIYNKTELKTKKILLLFFILAAIFSISQLSNSYWITNDENINNIFTNMGILPLLIVISNYTIILEAPFLLLIIYLFLQTLKSEKGKNKKHIFIVSWFYIVFLMIIVSPSLVPWFPGKLLPLLWIPTILIGLKGIETFSKKYKINEKKIMRFIIIISLPSIIFASIFVHTGPRTDFEFYTIPSTSEYNAMIFLKDQPEGIIIAKQKIGVLLPLVSNKKALIGPYPPQTMLNHEEKLNNSIILFDPGSSEDKKIEIIKKYNITYIIINNDIDTTSFKTITKKIYENENIKILKTI